MFLKKIEISGFKSFANRTLLDFSLDEEGGKARGITAVVGPNGSGKSNIADALRWVMGEQSMKNLRGKKSEDIIFAGSGKKSRLGSASVSLYLDNSDKKIPLDFEEVVISRKIFRSGESQYLINGSRTRLQDVVDVLAKAGVGKESYAIVNQGMADAVLNSSPLERRSIIEDAAGVKAYQIKKDRSMRKLESTRENLERVKELKEEIKPHLKMLRRQSEKAAQGEKVAGEILEKQTLLFSHLWGNFQKEKQIFTETKDDIGRQMMNSQRETDKLNDALAAYSKEKKSAKKQIELEEELQKLRTELNQLERELIVSEGRIEIEKERQKNIQVIEEIKSQAEEAPVDLSYVREGIEKIRRDQEKLVEKIKSVEKLEDLQEIKEYATVIWQRLFDLKSEIEKGRKNVATSVSQEKPEKSASLKSPENSEALVELQDKVKKTREVIKQAEEKIKKKEEEIRAEREKDAAERREFFELESAIRKKQEELGKLKDEFNESKISLAKVEVHEEDLKSQVLKELKKKVEDLPEPSGEINRQKLEEEIYKLKMKMEQIGGIDPLVVDEYQETQKRFDFLENESADLEKAIVSLKEVIKEMEGKVEKEFARTYDEINKEFSKYFRIIFGGGNAKLEKLKVQSKKLKVKEEIAFDQNKDEEKDGSDKEEEESQVGIEISACPPGKKISHLSMLSGGERSLSSLALLFAIISHNPPPFSILDEVEAALDEANSKRFGRIITELSRKTQFVIITHNRETMRQAALLYGVTMNEDGISKLLSVRLDQIGAGGKIDPERG